MINKPKCVSMNHHQLQCFDQQMHGFVHQEYVSNAIHGTVQRGKCELPSNTFKLAVAIIKASVACLKRLVTLLPGLHPIAPCRTHLSAFLSPISHQKISSRRCSWVCCTVDPWNPLSEIRGSWRAKAPASMWSKFVRSCCAVRMLCSVSWIAEIGWKAAAKLVESYQLFTVTLWRTVWNSSGRTEWSWL